MSIRVWRHRPPCAVVATDVISTWCDGGWFPDIALITMLGLVVAVLPITYRGLTLGSAVVASVLLAAGAVLVRRARPSLLVTCLVRLLTAVQGPLDGPRSAG